MKRLRKAAFAIFQSLGLLVSAEAATFVVTNTSDSGPGSFRNALANASLSPGIDVIAFSNVSGQITLLSAPETLGDTVITGPGARQLAIATPRIVIESGQRTTISGIKITASPMRPGAGVYGGVISNGGTLHLRECEVTSGSEYLARGAGIYSAGNLIISGSLIASNSSLASGLLYPPPPICYSGVGGGLYVRSGNVLITNTTFSGNFTASILHCSGAGGAVYVEGGNVVLVNCTLAGNSAGSGDDICNAGGAVTLVNSLLTGSTVGVIGTSSNNLFTNAAAAGLESLQDNGGPTLTHALAPSSPAIDRGTSAGAPIVDQRGVTRPQGPGWDIGAFEFERPPNSFKLDLAVTGPGTVSRDPDAIFFPSDTVVVVTANANEDYALAEWSGDAAGQDNPLLVRMDRDKSITANFQYAPATVISPPGATNYVVNTNGWGPGSFRQAIRDANASGGGTIRLSNVTGSIFLPLGLPSIRVNTRIYGPGPSNLFLNFASNGFVFSAGISGTISGMTIQSGWAPTRSGGAIFNAAALALRRVHFQNCGASNGGAIFNSGSLQVSDCVFKQNSAVSGGAIYNRGALRVASSLLMNNRSRARAMEDYAGGAAFYNEAGQARFETCAFSGNTAEGAYPATQSELNAGSGKGGGLYVAGGRVELFETLIFSNLTVGGTGFGDLLGQFSGNGGSALGSGIYTRDGTLALTNCALINNRAFGGSSPHASRFPGTGAPGSGGGICIDAANVYAANCTFSGNEVHGGITGGGGFPPLPTGGGAGGAGGAVTIYRGAALLANCTITGNRCLGGNYGGYYGTNFGQGIGGGVFNYSGAITFRNTIVSGNFGSTMGTNGVVASDLLGPGSSLGHNLIGTALGFSNFLASDLIGINPRLGLLQDNGGVTPTHALLASSPAIDAGASTLMTFDQRGQPRLVDNPAIPNRMNSNGTDIGALEVDHNLRMTSARRLGSNMLVRFTSVSDKIYGVEFKAEASDSEWLRVPVEVQGSGGIVTATNVGGAEYPQRFYRALERPR